MKSVTMRKFLVLKYHLGMGIAFCHNNREALYLYLSKMYFNSMTRDIFEQYCSNLAFSRVLNFLGRYGGSVTSMSIALPRLGRGIKVTPIRTCLEPSI